MATPIERLMAKVDVNPGGCWEWTASKNRDGYGKFATGRGGWIGAHRAAYQLIVGPIPDGKELDHLCRNRGCVNPDHLEPVEHKVNVRRGALGQTTAARQRGKTHCPQGHEYTPENTRMCRTGRSCRQCQSDRNAARGQLVKGG